MFIIMTIIIGFSFVSYYLHLYMYVNVYVCIYNYFIVACVMLHVWLIFLAALYVQ